MQSLPEYPDLQKLTTGLSVVLHGNGYAGQITVAERKPNIFSSTFLSEIVTCRIGDRGERQFLCKYGTDQNDITLRHRGGTPYEARIYREILRPSQFSTAMFYGAYSDSATGQTWLILDYLEKSKRVSRFAEPTAMIQAAGWIGRFHATNRARLASEPMVFLKKYDAAFYTQWIRRTLMFARDLSPSFPWLAKLCQRSEKFFTPLIATPPVIIHGEYYPHNILFRDGVVYPVDWESAAVAAGEIDLAALTDRWPADVARACELEYQRARWPEGPPAEFEERLAVAQLYLPFRWLGDPPEWNEFEERLALFKLLHSAGTRLGLI